MGKEIEAYTRECHDCAVNKSHPTVRTPLKPVERMMAWRFVSIDHVGPFKKTKRGYTHVMVIMDRSTRWVELVAVKGASKDGGMTSAETLRKYKKRVECRHGQPTVILTDGSTSFKGEFEAYLKEQGVEHRVGKAYHHNTNGMAKRMIRTLEEALRHYVGPQHEDWDSVLGEIQCSLNTHRAAGPLASPFMLNRGREHVAPGKQKYAGHDIEVIVDEEEVERAEEEGVRVEEEVRRVNEEAEKANQKAQERMKKAYDKRERVDEEKLVKIGEWVMVKLVEERVGGALEPRNEGPYKVVAVDENRNCELEGMGKGLRKTYPMDVLSVFHGAPQRQEFTRSQEINLGGLVKSAKGGAKAKVTRAVKSVREVIRCGETVKPSDMMGQRVKVTWNLKFAKGDYKGELVDYDPHSKLFYVRYDKPDKNGVYVFEDPLLSTTMPPWIMLPVKAKKIMVNTGKEVKETEGAEGDGE